MKLKHLLTLSAFSLALGSALILPGAAKADLYNFTADWSNGGNQYHATLLFDSTANSLAVSNASNSSFSLDGLFLTGANVGLTNGSAVGWSLTPGAGTVSGHENGSSDPVTFSYTDLLSADAAANYVAAGGTSTFDLTGTLDLTANSGSPFAVQFNDGASTVVVDVSGPVPEPAFFQLAPLLGLGGFGLLRLRRLGASSLVAEGC